MRMMGYACLGGLEIGNANRTRQYIQNLGGPRWQVTEECGCDALDVSTAISDVENFGYDNGLWDAGLYNDVAFSSPAADEAPWYDAQRPESAEFLGLYPTFIGLGNVLAREMTPRSGEGGFLSSPSLTSRVVSVNGILAATSARGMYYGERWLTEALRGCCGCAGDTLTILPSCPSTVAGSASDPYFRDLVNVALIDYVPARAVKDGMNETAIQEVSFQLASELPYIYRPVGLTSTNTVTTEAVWDTFSHSTPDIATWPGDATMRITIEATTSDVQNVTITARPSLSFTSVPTHEGYPCWGYRVETLPRDGRITIDGRSRRVTYYDPTLKLERSGYPLLDPYVSDSVNGDLFAWPDVPPCTMLGIHVDNAGFTSVEVTVERFDREL